MSFINSFTKIQVKTSGAKINLAHGGSGSPLLLLHEMAGVLS